MVHDAGGIDDGFDASYSTLGCLFRPDLPPTPMAEAACAVNADCHFPNGICRDGACMCDGLHVGADCAGGRQTLLRWMLRAGLPLLCLAAALLGLLLGGLSRWCYGRVQRARETTRQKSLMFGAGWTDNDRYIGPQHRRVLEKRAERKAKKKKKKHKQRRREKKQERGRSAERTSRGGGSAGSSRSRSRSGTRSQSRGR